jgi:hypothetical protein
MKLTNMCAAIVNTVSIAVVILLACVTIAAQTSQTAPAPNRNITAPVPQKHGPPAGPQQPLPGTTAPRQIVQTAGAGTIEGFVYWDTASISHTPASSCGGLAVTVAEGNSTGGKSTAYQSLATLSNNFKYVGQVKQFVTGGKIKVYDVCTYGYAHVPVGPDLRVTVIADTASLSQPAPFSPMSVPQKDPVGPITIINGQCNMLPRIVNPTASDLFSHWGTCQNMAYDVNFMMQPATQVLNSRPTGVSSGPSGNQMGMLSRARQQGMLAPGNTQASGGSGGMLAGAVVFNQNNSSSIAGVNTSSVQTRQTAPVRNVPTGIVTGWLYWDGSETPTFVSQPPDVSPCDAWQVKLSAGTLALTATLTWEGGHNNYGFCFYKVDHVPERQPLQLQISLAQPSKSFFKGQWAGFGPLGVPPSGLIIPGGACQTPLFDSPANATAPNSAAVACGNRAYNVNFALHPRYEVRPNEVGNSAIAVQH